MGKKKVEKGSLAPLVASATNLQEAIAGLRNVKSGNDEVEAAFDGVRIALNRIIVEILRKHLSGVIVRLDPRQSQVWGDSRAVLEVVYETVILRIPVPVLRSRDAELSVKIRNKIMEFPIELNADTANGPVILTILGRETVKGLQGWEHSFYRCSVSVGVPVWPATEPDRYKVGLTDNGHARCICERCLGLYDGDDANSYGPMGYPRCLDILGAWKETLFEIVEQAAEPMFGKSNILAKAIEIAQAKAAELGGMYQFVSQMGPDPDPDPENEYPPEVTIGREYQVWRTGEGMIGWIIIPDDGPIETGGVLRDWVYCPYCNKFSQLTLPLSTNDGTAYQDGSRDRTYWWETTCGHKANQPHYAGDKPQTIRII